MNTVVLFLKRLFWYNPRDANLSNNFVFMCQNVCLSEGWQAFYMAADPVAYSDVRSVFHEVHENLSTQ